MGDLREKESDGTTGKTVSNDLEEKLSTKRIFYREDEFTQSGERWLHKNMIQLHSWKRLHREE